MTALAGWVADRPLAELESACACMLEALGSYSRQPARLAVSGSAVFGAALFPTLPEDDFDIQPIAFGGRLLIADIRIDNRADLLEGLGIQRSDGRHMPDSALLAHAWQRWDEDCLQRIIGDFAIAVYDHGERKLILARDVTGQRPLFYTENSGGLALASMPSGLLALESNRRGFNREALAQVLADIRPEADASYFNGIRRVPAGHILRWASGSVASRRFWKPSRNPIILRSQEDYVEAYREVLSSAVEGRMRRRSPTLATQLSSGFDSSAVTATAALLLQPGDHQIAFTAAPRLGFEAPMPRGRIADESLIAARTAAMHGIEHVVLRNAGSIFSHIAPEAGTYQEPFRNIINNGWSTALEHAAVERGAAVMLAGDLGNLTLNYGSLEVFADMIAEGNWRSWWREAVLARRSCGVRWRGILINSFEPWLPSSVRAGIYSLFNRPRLRPGLSFLRSEWRERVECGTVDGRASTADTFVDRWTVLSEFDFGTVRKGTLGTTGVDIRDVMADQRIIQFSLNLPRQQVFLNGRTRPLARWALADRVPAAVIESRVRGLQAADWYEHADLSELRVLVEQASTSATAKALIDFEELHRAIDEWPSRGFERMDVIEKFVGFVPTTLATALFIKEFEPIAGSTV